MFFASISESIGPIFEILFDSESEKCAKSKKRIENNAATTEIPQILAICRFSSEFCEYNIRNKLLTIKYRLPFTSASPFLTCWGRVHSMSGCVRNVKCCILPEKPENRHLNRENRHLISTACGKIRVIPLFFIRFSKKWYHFFWDGMRLFMQ